MLFVALSGCASKGNWNNDLVDPPSDPEAAIRSLVKVGDDIWERVEYLESRGWKTLGPRYATIDRGTLSAIIYIGDLRDTSIIFEEITGKPHPLQRKFLVDVSAKPDGKIYEIE